MESEETHEEQEGTEVASEALEHFKSAVYFPANESLSLREKCCIPTIHSSNVLCVIPWEKNDHILFSTDVTKTLYCVEWDEETSAVILAQVGLSAPCCSLALLQGGSVLVAGCMDGMAYCFRVEQSNYHVSALTVGFRITFHE